VGPSGEDDLPGLSLQLVRVAAGLPEGFGALRAEAEAEGHRHMGRLAQEAADQGLLLALLAAFDAGQLVGVGAITRDPADPGAIRMRRLYVAPAARRRGVGSALANALLCEALAETPTVTVHAGNTRAARFWEGLGFVPVAGRPWSHVYSAA
jgi:GNAT superfamily N-acetyltransferase